MNKVTSPSFCQFCNITQRILGTVSISSVLLLSTMGYAETYIYDGNASAWNPTLPDSLTGEVTLQTDSEVTYDKIITDGADGKTILTKTGTGTLILNQKNTFTGGTFVTNGTLKLAASGNPGTLSPGSTVTVNGAGSVLELAIGDPLGYYNDSFGIINLQNYGTMKATAGHSTIGGTLNMENGIVTGTTSDGAHEFIFDNQINALSGENLIDADSVQFRDNSGNYNSKPNPGVINVAEGAKLTITSELSTGNVAKLTKNGAGELVFDKSLWTPNWNINDGTLTLNAQNTRFLR